MGNMRGTHIHTLGFLYLLYRQRKGAAPFPGRVVFCVTMIRWPVVSCVGIFATVIIAAELLPHMRLLRIENQSNDGSESTTLYLYGNGHWATRDTSDADAKMIIIIPRCTVNTAESVTMLGTGPYYVACVALRPISITLRVFALFAMWLHLMPGQVQSAMVPRLVIGCGIVCVLLFLTTSIISLAAVSGSLHAAVISPGAQVVEWIGLAASIGVIFLACGPSPRRRTNEQTHTYADENTELVGRNSAAEAADNQ